MVFFDIADYWHKVYALYVEAAVKYAAPTDEMVDEIHDEKSCYLGLWLAKARYAALPEFENLHLQHRRFHEIASTAIQAVNRKNVASAGLNEITEAVRRSSLAVTDAILRLNRVVAPNSTCVQDDSEMIDTPIRKYKLGVPVIDDQHYALSGLARRLLECPAAAFSAAENVELVAQLAALTDLHFRTEEIYMRSIQLPPLEMAKHIAAHKQILDSITRLSTNAGQLEHLTVGNVIPKFSHWFIDHLIDYDYSLKRY